MSQNILKNPVIAVLGVTGAGKSKLAIELAERLGTEIISADSMQVYKGLDIITNKVTAEECRSIKHHLISSVDIQKRFTVVDFRNAALSIVENLLKMGKTPVIAGGTNYYLESILWNQLINSDSDTMEKSVRKRKKSFVKLKALQESSGNQEEPEDDCKLLGVVPGFEDNFVTEEAVAGISSSDLHELLISVDEKSATTLHPNDRRKIIRALQVCQQSGRRLSEILSEQRSLGGSPLGGPLRYKNAIVFWVQSNQAELEDRLTRRTDDMLQRGLAKELSDFHEMHTKPLLDAGRVIDYNQGIYQAIGYKEFSEWLDLTPEQRDAPAGQKLLRDGVERLNLVSARYARKQIKWIKKRFLQQPDREVPPIYSLDSTDLSKWDTEVRDRAFSILDSHLKGEQSPFDTMPFQESKRVEQKTFRCEMCSKVLIGELQWREHEQGRVHKLLRAKKKKAQSQTEKPTDEKELQ